MLLSDKSLMYQSGLLLWHFLHRNPILCSILLKDCCSREKFISSYYWKDCYTSWKNFFSTWMFFWPHTNSFDHTQIKIVNDYISVGFSRSFLSCGVKRAFFVSVFTLPFEVFFNAVFTYTPQYFAILSSMRQTGEVTAFSLHGRLMWFINSLTSRWMILFSFPLVDFYLVFTLQQAKCQIFAEH